jgi:cytochrome b561
LLFGIIREKKQKKFKKKDNIMKYSLAFRIWHWLNAVVVLGLLGTVFLRKTFLSWRTNSEILLTKLSDMDYDVTAEETKILAKAIRAGMWEWHIILGYALAFLVIYRMALFFFDNSQKVDFASLNMHKKAVKISYYIIYATLFFMAVSGFMIYFYQGLGFSRELAHNIKEIHEVVYNVLFIWTPLHVAGVFVADAKDENGLISSMVHGKKI